MKKYGVVFLCTLLAASSLAGPAHAQGMISAPNAAQSALDEGLDQFAEVKAQETVTLQRLLRRLGYLKDENMTREMDAETVTALLAHLKDVKIPPAGMTPERAIRSLFLTIWNKEGWASGQVAGQDLVVDTQEVKTAQDALKNLGYEPGPADGVFGPATLSAIEIFQEDNGMKITGLLTRNMQHNITRAAKFIGRPPASTLHMLNWADYVDPGVLDGFEKETNIRIVHEEFDNSEETKELLSQGSDKYDLMVQSGAQLRQIVEQQNLVEKLDRAKLPNAKNLDPAAAGYTDALDPGNIHSIPYLWGTTGLGLNKERIRKIRPDAPVNSLALILDPEYAADLAKCGIAMIDEPVDVIPVLAAYVGADRQNLTTTELEAVEEALTKVQAYVKAIPVDSFINNLSDGKYCVTIGYSGDVYAARDRAKQNNTGVITYAVPKEGSQLWFDMLVIPAKAKNKEGAYKLLDYLMKPEVAAATTNYLQYANAVTPSAQFIEPQLLTDPGLYPPKAVLKRLGMQPPLPVNVETEIKRIWEKIKKE